MKNADLIKLKYPTRNVFSHLQYSTMSLFKFVLEEITIKTLSNILIRMKKTLLLLLVKIPFAFIQDETSRQKFCFLVSCYQQLC